MSYNNFGYVRGPKIGIVQKITDDKSKLNKVRVIIPEENNLDVGYASVITDYAGKKFGSVNIPSVGQPVIVDFLNGNINQPIILGCIYAPKFEPPLNIDKKNEIVYLKTAAGMEIKIENKKDKQKVSIKTKKGHMINLDDDKETATISSKNGKNAITLKLKKGEIEINSEKKITFKAGKDTMTLADGKGLNIKSNAGKITANVKEFKVTAKTNVNIKGNSNVTIDSSQKTTLKSKANVQVSGMGVKMKANTNLDLKASVKASLQGSTMLEVKGGVKATLQGSAMTEVKGGIVKIN